MIIILRPIFDTGIDGSITGNLLFVISTLSFVVYTILLKDYKFPYSAATVTFYLFMFATVIFFPFFLWEMGQSTTEILISERSIIGILFAAILTSVVGYVFYNFALKYIRASETGIFLYIDPVITVLIAVPLLGEQVTPSFIIGAVLVFLGIFIAERRLQYHPIHKLKKHS
jgi:drug/metabolite transporter (DMT)-like permease